MEKMKSHDNIELQGYYLAAKEPTNKTVVFAHGYLGNTLQMSLYGKYYYEKLDYNLFMPNLRGHGKSGGDYYGFGWHDYLDLIGLMETFITENEDVEILMHGLSMGALAVLMASGEPLPKQVRAIITE